MRDGSEQYGWNARPASTAPSGEPGSPDQRTHPPDWFPKLDPASRAPLIPPPPPKFASSSSLSSPSPPSSSSALDQDKLLSYFLAGGAAGAASRTVVSPLERLKIIMQVQPHAKSGSARPKGSYSGVWSGLVKMWKEEGIPGLFRGNGINCLRIAPYSAVQFATYEVLKAALVNPDPNHPGEGHLTPLARFTAGSVAGITSVVSTYPLDLVRARISIATADMMVRQSQAQVQGTAAAAAVAAGPPPRIPGVWDMTVKVYREEGGMRGLYRGCIPVSLGLAPYIAGNFLLYESFRGWIVRARDSARAHTPATGWLGSIAQVWAHMASPDESVTGIEKLIAGAVAGTISQTATYPLDVLRRRMQVAGMPDGKAKLGYNDKTTYDVFATIIRHDGIRGMYRGLWPNLLKVAPSIGVSFGVYEWVRALLKPKPAPSLAATRAT